MFVDPAAVVEEREEADDVHHGSRARREDQGVALNPPPVIGAVDGVWGAMVWEGADVFPEFGEIDGVCAQEATMIAGSGQDINPPRPTCVIEGNDKWNVRGRCSRPRSTI